MDFETQAWHRQVRNKIRQVQQQSYLIWHKLNPIDVARGLTKPMGTSYFHSISAAHNIICSLWPSKNYSRYGNNCMHKSVLYWVHYLTQFSLSNHPQRTEVQLTDPSELSTISYISMLLGSVVNTESLCVCVCVRVLCFTEFIPGQNCIQKSEPTWKWEKLEWITIPRQRSCMQRGEERGERESGRVFWGYSELSYL